MVASKGDWMVRRGRDKASVFSEEKFLSVALIISLESLYRNQNTVPKSQA